MMKKLKCLIGIFSFWKYVNLTLPIINFYLRFDGFYLSSKRMDVVGLG